MSSIPLELAATVAAIVDAGSLDQAARALRMTPSAVSQRLKNLEQQLGRVLVVRERPVRATEAGQAVIRLARQVELLERDARAELGLDSGEAGLSIALAVNADSLATWFLPPLARLTERYGVVFDLRRDDQAFTARLLESGEVLAAVTSEAVPVAGCTGSPLGVLRYRAVATEAFIARWFPAGVTRRALERAPFIDFDRRDGLQQDWLRAQGVEPGGVPRHYVPASHDFAAAVGLGLGWGMLPLQQLPAASAPLRHLGGPDSRVPLYWQQGNLRSRLLDAIADEIRAEAARVLTA